MADAKRMVRVFDTTLRDGEQSPGCSMNTAEKIEVAKRLEMLNVDIIEAGYPASSPGDLESVRIIAATIKQSAIAGLCRALEKDIDAAREALQKAASPRVHIFLATSPIHMEYKLKMTPEQVLERAVDAVKYAKKFCADVEFSAEDAFRSEPDFVCKVFSAVIAAGASTVNFPDTVGYAMPQEFGARVRYIISHTTGMEKALLSVHCHNDLGLAVANSLAAIEAGAGQAECTINGIGERAGNASLEEIVMALRVRKDYYNVDTRIESAQIYPASRLVSQVTGVKVQPNKAIVGENAFAHESGIHQHGVLANPATYEIMTPESVGISKKELVLGKHSGKHALSERLAELGFVIKGKALDEVFANFKALADSKKTVSDRDIEALVIGTAGAVPEKWKLDRWVINAGSSVPSISAIRLEAEDGGMREAVHFGNGCVDAAFSAINKLVGKEVALEMFELGAITGDTDAQGEAMVKISYEGGIWNGRGVSTNIIESAIKAYVAAINSMESESAQRSS
ncbi:MAG: 2-isopropylmalate synthase [Spirochaetaceae bacterium]|jgi:2-isopropylmalate synthase|nr:2-isopropylmalate synthase [Spirochaetaceae bacterium]